MLKKTCDQCADESCATCKTRIRNRALAAASRQRNAARKTESKTAPTTELTTQHETIVLKGTDIMPNATTDTQIKKVHFDYNSLDRDKARGLRQQATAIKAAIKRTQNDIIEIGNRLLDVKEDLQHGEFQTWVSFEFGMSYETANRFMRVSSVFKNVNLTDLNFDKSALYALAAPSVSDETRQVAVELAESGETVTHADAKALIEAAKPQATDSFPESIDDEATDIEDDADEEFEPESAPPEGVDGYGRPISQQVGRGTRNPNGVYVETTTEIINADLPEVERAPQPLTKAETDALNDDDWLALLPLRQKLIDESIPTITFDAAALSYRKLEKQITALKSSVKATVSEAANDPFSDRIRSIGYITHPSKWTFSRGSNGGFIL